MILFLAVSENRQKERETKVSIWRHLHRVVLNLEILISEISRLKIIKYSLDQACFVTSALQILITVVLPCLALGPLYSALCVHMTDSNLPFKKNDHSARRERWEISQDYLESWEELLQLLTVPWQHGAHQCPHCLHAVAGAGQPIHVLPLILSSWVSLPLDTFKTNTLNLYLTLRVSSAYSL